MMSSTDIDELEEQRRELELRRAMLEERFKLRIATAQEFGVVHTRRLNRVRQAFAAQCDVARRRNQDVVEGVRRTFESCVSEETAAATSLSRKQLSRQTERFLSTVENLYPAWQDRRLEMKAAGLQALEDERVATEHRRRVVQNMFDREQVVEAALEERRRLLAETRTRELNDAAQRRSQREYSSAQARHKVRSAPGQTGKVYHDWRLVGSRDAHHGNNEQQDEDVCREMCTADLNAREHEGTEHSNRGAQLVNDDPGPAGAVKSGCSLQDIDRCYQPKDEAERNSFSSKENVAMRPSDNSDEQLRAKAEETRLRKSVAAEGATRYLPADKSPLENSGLDLLSLDNSRLAPSESPQCSVDTEHNRITSHSHQAMLDGDEMSSFSSLNEFVGTSNHPACSPSRDLAEMEGHTLAEPDVESSSTSSDSASATRRNTPLRSHSRGTQQRGSNRDKAQRAKHQGQMKHDTSADGKSDTSRDEHAEGSCSHDGQEDHGRSAEDVSQNVINDTALSLPKAARVIVTLTSRIEQLAGQMVVHSKGDKTTSIPTCMLHGYRSASTSSGLSRRAALSAATATATANTLSINSRKECGTLENFELDALCGAVLDVLTYRASDILPEKLLSGLVTAAKVRAQHRKKGPDGRVQLFDAFFSHIRSLTTSEEVEPHAVAAIFVQCFSPFTSRESNGQQNSGGGGSERLRRKVLAVLESAVDPDGPAPVQASISREPGTALPRGAAAGTNMSGNCCGYDYAYRQGRDRSERDPEDEIPGCSASGLARSIETGKRLSQPHGGHTMSTVEQVHDFTLPESRDHASAQGQALERSAGSGGKSSETSGTTADDAYTSANRTSKSLILSGNADELALCDKTRKSRGGRWGLRSMVGSGLLVGIGGGIGKKKNSKLNISAMAGAATSSDLGRQNLPEFEMMDDASFGGLT